MRLVTSRPVCVNDGTVSLVQGFRTSNYDRAVLTSFIFLLVLTTLRRTTRVAAAFDALLLASLAVAASFFFWPEPRIERTMPAAMLTAATAPAAYAARGCPCCRFFRSSGAAMMAGMSVTYVFGYDIDD